MFYRVATQQTCWTLSLGAISVNPVSDLESDLNFNAIGIGMKAV